VWVKAPSAAPGSAPYLPAAGGAAAIGKTLFCSDSLGLIVAVLWMLAFATGGVRAHRFRCPRCGGRFTFKGWLLFGFSNPFTGKCLHCGVRVGDEPPATA
jgi:hypothetical protein